MVSYNVKALLILVPVDLAISIIQNKLQKVPPTSSQDLYVPQHIITLLEFCLKNTYFLSQDKYIEQVHGAAMGSPISPLIANLFMEEFESKAISAVPNPTRLRLSM